MSAIPSPGQQKHFIVGARPVRLVCHADGSLAVEAIDWKTGEMVRATEYLTRIMGGDVEVDEVSTDDFDRAVAEIRARLSAD